MKVVDMEVQSFIASSTTTESFSKGSNAWTQNDGEDENFFKN